ncbi:MAG: hypothetical protein J6A62_05215 [Oscillospiraceae bacterium]|nr:hypothetical protein [Oscillospiraceae bacterium]
MELDSLQGALAGFLEERGVPAMACWPEGRRKRLEGPVVLVSLKELECSPAGLQDYLGEKLDEATGQWKELYGRRARLVFALDIIAPPGTPAEECRSLFEQMVRVFQTHKPGGLTVQEMTAKELEYDEQEGLVKLSSELGCDGWLCAWGDEAGTFLDFTLRGDVNT